MKTVGYLRAQSPLLEIFPSGEVPLLSLIVLLGHGGRPDTYSLDPTKITEEQREKIVAKLALVGCDRVQAMDEIDRGLQLALSHFLGVETTDPRQVELMKQLGCDND